MTISATQTQLAQKFYRLKIKIMKRLKELGANPLNRFRQLDLLYVRIFEKGWCCINLRVDGCWYVIFSGAGSTLDADTGISEVLAQFAWASGDAGYRRATLKSEFGDKSFIKKYVRENQERLLSEFTSVMEKALAQLKRV